MKNIKTQHKHPVHRTYEQVAFLANRYLQKTSETVTIYLFLTAMIQGLQGAQKEIEQISHFDTLTQLANRNQYDQDLKRELARAKRYSRKLAILYIDLDFFKKINENLGHHIGDALLKEAANRLRKVVRLEDYIARLGGDEFAVILTEVDNPNDAGLVAKRIVESMGDSFEIDDQIANVGASIGIAFYPEAGLDPTTLNKNADIALYSAKESGRGNYQFFTKDMQETQSEKLKLEAELHFALQRNEFFLAYQPRFDLQSEKLVGMEVLIRWQHPQRGLIPPTEFISIAEETGLIVPIGKWVLETACQQFTEWRHQYKNLNVTLAINVSPRQFQSKDFIKIITTILEKNNLPPQLLELEVTETSVTSYLGKIENTLFQLRDLGVKFSIDDFGTGYSSLTRLKQLPIHSIKIDRTFVSDIDVKVSDNVIVKSTLELAKNMGLNAVAEGVETESQLRFLIKNNCPEAQGYYYSKPLSRDEMTVFIKKYF